MGNSGSTEPKEVYTHGFHVLRVKPNSPGAVSNLIPFFDFIVSVNDILMNDEKENSFVQILEENINKAINLRVYNSKNDTLRTVELTPRSDWSETGKELLGVSIRFCEIKTAKEFVWHVLEVFPNSPASEAGFISNTDYIVGSTITIFQDEEDLFKLVRDFMGKPLEFFVYNQVTDSIRLVKITPNREWGGSGSLGCNVAYGLLHRIDNSGLKERSSAQPQPTNTPHPVGIPEPESLPANVLNAKVEPTYSPASFQPKPFIPSVAVSPVISGSGIPAPSPVPSVHVAQPSPTLVAQPAVSYPSPNGNLPRPEPVFSFASHLSGVQPGGSFTPTPSSLTSTNVQMPQFSSLPTTPNANADLDLVALQKRRETLQAQLQALRQQMTPPAPK